MPGLEGITAVVHCSSDVQAQRLRNCILSVRRQEFDQSKVDIVVGCIRKEQDDLSELRALVLEFGGILVSMENWCPTMNTALARNLGARRANRLITCFIDVDAVMDPENFALAYPLVRDGRHVIFVRHCHMNNPLEDEIYRLSKKEFRRAQEKSTLHDTNVGGNVFILTSYVQAIRGYDEHMFGWGAEDHDVLVRIGKSKNFPVAYGLDCLPVVNMHQHHPLRDWRKNTFFERNFKILIENERIGGRYINPKFWGGIPVEVVSVDAGYPLDLPPENGQMGNLNPEVFEKEMAIGVQESPAVRISNMKVAAKERERLAPLLWEKNAFDLPGVDDYTKITTVWDVGAGCGLYSTWASMKFSKATIHSFEPCSFLAHVAFENMQHINNVQVHRFGLSKEPSGMVPVITKARDGLLEFRIAKNEEATNYELFCSMKESFGNFCKSEFLDVIRFDSRIDHSDFLSALDDDQVSKVRYVQTEGIELNDDRFQRVETNCTDVFCFKNKKS